jgi:hypothetical protein
MGVLTLLDQVQPLTGLLASNGKVHAFCIAGNGSGLYGAIVPYIVDPKSV